MSATTTKKDVARPGSRYASWDISPLEWVVLAAAWASSMLILGAIGWRVAVDGLTWSGSIGGLAEDTMQYLTWTRDASLHILVGNDYTLSDASRNYLHPGFVGSGILHRLGLSIPLSYAVWVPVAAGAVCWGTFGFVSENIAKSKERVVALTLALFYAVPAALIAGLLPANDGLIFKLFIAREPQTLTPLWGYPYSALAVGLTALSLVAYIRGRKSGKTFSPALIAGVVFTGWLQPWQGATVIATVVASELLLRTRRFSSLTPSAPKAWLLGASASLAGVVPLAYYALLGRFDSTFIESERNLAMLAPAEHWWLLLLAVLPLLLPALLVARMRVPSVAGLTARIWPAMAIGQALVLGGFSIASSPSHALRGVAIPLSVLAVTGVSHLLRGDHHWPRVAVAIVGIVMFALVGTVSTERAELNAVSGSGLGSKVANYFVSHDRLAAYAWLANSPIKGGVFGDRTGLGATVPWRTGRKVWAGHLSWSPKSPGRFNATEVVLSGAPCCRTELLKMPAGRFVQATGARFLMTSCATNVLLVLKQLDGAVESVHRFGCVAVIQIRATRATADKAAVESIYGAGK
jgi:hypothetical protein